MSLTAIFGGTFNPFHIGHYEILQELENSSDISEIFLMPDRIPPHKVCDFLADDDIRIEMCRIVAEDFSKVKLCLVEFERESKSYTYDTIKELQKKYPYKNFAFVCGGDMLASFDKWYRYEELLKMLPFIAFRRSDTDNELFDSKAEFLRKKGMEITVMDRIITSVASSGIRSDFSKAEQLIPKKVFEYLKDKGIYNAK